MPVARMRLRPWLEDRLDSETISGLVWLDKEKKIFSIPWKHAARHGWEMEKDACLFKQWAIHTGKFKVGMSSPDPKTWKANFRCAMNSLPDIVEVKDKSVNKGCGAVRVYKMLQTVPKKRDKRSRTRDAKQKNKNRIMDDECPNVNEVDLLMDHNSYTKEEEDSRVDSTGNLYFSHKQYSTDREVPEWSSPMEMRADSTNIYSTFQVSPSHSSEFGEESEIIQMAQQLEQDQSQWLHGNVNDSGYLSSAVNDTSDSYDSHQSQWSEDSVEEIELRLYTELKAGPSESIDLVSYLDPWASSTINILQQSPCLL